MARSKSGAWIAGAVALSLLLGGAAWFLAISPVMDSAQESRDLTIAQRDQNAILQSRLVVLKAESLKLEEHKATLAALQVQVPPTDAMANFQRELAALAAVRQVTVVSVTVSSADPIAPVAVAAPVDASADPAAPTDATQPSTDAPATDPAAAGPGLEGFYQLPVSVEVVGTYANVQGFLGDLQTGTQRLFLVTALSGSSTTEAEAAGGRPATARGDLSLVITGSAFVLVDTQAVPAPVDPAAVPAPLPVPPGDKNPLAPPA